MLRGGTCFDRSATARCRPWRAPCAYTSHRKGAHVQIERAGAAQDRHGVRARNLERELAVAHIDERMRLGSERVLEALRRPPRAIRPARHRPDRDRAADIRPAPSHSVARDPEATARHASTEKAAPQRGAANARAAGPPCRIQRPAGGSNLSQSVDAMAGGRRCASSAIDPRSRRVVENRRGDLDLDIAAGHGHVQGLPMRARPPATSASAIGIAEDAAGIRGGDMADQLHRRPLPGLGGDLCAFLEHGAPVAGCAGPRAACDPGPSSTHARASVCRRSRSCVLPIAQLRPASSGVTVPSVSWPTMM